MEMCYYFFIEEKYFFFFYLLSDQECLLVIYIVFGNVFLGLILGYQLIDLKEIKIIFVFYKLDSCVIFLWDQ